MATRHTYYEILSCIQSMLRRRNQGYGSSALNPLRVFSSAPPNEQICVRIDDKLSRLMRGDESDGEMRVETVGDLIGYLAFWLAFDRAEGTPDLDAVIWEVLTLPFHTPDAEQDLKYIIQGAIDGVVDVSYLILDLAQWMAEQPEVDGWGRKWGGYDAKATD